MTSGSTCLVTRVIKLMCPDNHLSVCNRAKLVIMVATVMCMCGSVRSNGCPLWQNSQRFGVGDHILPFGQDLDLTSLFLPLNNLWVDFSQDFTFFGETFRRMRIAPQGFVYFNVSDDLCSRDTFPYQDYEKVIAPFWTFEDRSGRFSGQLYFREILPDGSEEQTQWYCLLDHYVNSANLASTTFTTSWAYVVTWYKLLPNNWTNRPRKRNNFQLVLFSGVGMTFALFNYDRITWSEEDQHGCADERVKIGYSAGNDVDFFVLNTDGVPLERFLRETEGTKTRQPKRWLFRVDRKSEETRRCVETGKITDITPSSGHPFGGYVITIRGYCVEVGSSPVCRFGDVTVEGDANDGVMTCTVPVLGVRGMVKVDLSVDNGRTFPAFAEILTGTHGGFYSISISDPESWLSLPPSEQLYINTTDSHQGTQTFHLDMVTFPGDDSEMVAVRLAENVDTSGVINLKDIKLTSLNPELRLPLATFGAMRITNQKKGISYWSNLVGADWYIYQLLREVVMTTGATLIDDEYAPVYGRLRSLASQEGITGTENILSFLGSNFPDVLQVIFGPKCKTWSEEEAEDLSYLSSILPPSPVNENHAYYDPDYRPDPSCSRKNRQCLYSPGAHTCYRYQNHIDGRYGLRVCYDEVGEYISEGDFVLGTTEVHSPLWDSAAFYWREVRPYYYCCKWSRNCAIYRDKRVVPFIGGYVPVKAAWSGGDPHFKPFDGQGYTFNGIGEFWLVNTDVLKVQGRSAEAYISTGDLRASIWQSFAAKTDSSSRIEIRYDSSDTGEGSFVIMVESEIIDHEYLQLEEEPLEISGLLISLKDDIVEVVFEQGSKCSGAALEVKTKHAAPQMMLTLTKCYRGHLKGLLGNFNGDDSDDLQTMDGHVYPANSTLEILHHVLESWRTKPEESLFSYPSGRNHASYQDLNFLPYLPESSELLSVARGAEVCGDNLPCLYDLMVSGDEELAKSTLEGVRALINITTTIKPNVTCPRLEAPPGGKLVSLVVLYVPGDVVEVSCNEGTIPNGTLQRVCQPDGTWNGTPASCQEDDTIPPTPSLNRTGLILTIVFSVLLLGILVAALLGSVIGYRRRKLRQISSIQT